MRLLLPSLLLVACQDYELHGKTDQPGDDTTPADSGPGTTQTFSDLCDGLEATPHEVPLNEECDVDLQTGSFTPVVEFHYGNSTFCGPPAVAQIVDSNGSGGIDDDDLPAIVLFQQGKVVALKGDNSGTYWTSRQGQLGQDGGFAVGDLDGDGFPEVIAAASTTVSALDGQTGDVLWTSPNLARSMDALGYNYPAVSDMDHDGTPEVTVGNVILSGLDGSVVGQGRLGKGAAPYGGSGTSMYGTLSVPADLDGDGLEELVTGNAAYNIDGSVKWENGDVDGLIAVADFDGDGDGEIVKTSGIYVTGLDTDGSELWSNTYSGNLGAPAIDDLDGDGLPEVVFAAQNSLVCLEALTGRTKWTARISDQSGAAGPVLFDFELDGYPEVLYADETSIQFFSGLDGSVKFRSTEHGSYTILETPVVADVDNDDQVEIVLGHCSWTKSLSVYGDADQSWPPGRKIWNQHGYQITNVGDFGSVPRVGGPNWPDYNSFRSGDVGTPPGEWLDLQAEIFDVCETECSEDKVYVGAWVMNAGNLEAPAGVPVSVTNGPNGSVLATQTTTTAIAPGEVGEPLVFEISATALGDRDPTVIVDRGADGSDVVNECDEGNNVATWTAGVCK